LRVGRYSFLVVSQKRLPRLYSDHVPFLLDCGDISKGAGPSNLKTCGLWQMVLWGW
jgi:hypothetical protein